jgi:imidazolonepropionase-like amidohydrolase
MGTDGPVPITEADSNRQLEGLRQAGVLAIRDTGAATDFPLRLATAATPEVTVLACGRFLSSPDHYFPDVYTAVGPDALTPAAVAELSRGATWVKLIADFPPGADARLEAEASYDLDTIADLIKAVHGAGGRVAAHCTTPLAAELVRLGVDSIEHGSRLDAPSVHQMAERGIAWCPTVTPVTGLGPDSPRERAARVAETEERLRELLPLAARLGVPLLTGSDIVGTVVGEVSLLTEYGVEPSTALAAATTTARDFLRLPRLSDGAPADVVTYEDDPRDDPDVLRRPMAVVVRGRRIR